MYNPFDFNGRKIIITGGTSGIGLATVEALSRQGATLSLIGRNETKLKGVLSELEGWGHSYYIKDLCEPWGFENIFDNIISDGKKIDGLVYSAAIVDIQPLGRLSQQKYEKSMAVNLYSFIEMVRLLSKKKYHDKCEIVAVSSGASLSPIKCQTIYSATKAALNNVVHSLSIELLPKNIRINAVMPGSVKTSTLNKYILIEQSFNEEKVILNGIEINLDSPEEIADVIMFLLSPASNVISGRSIYACKVTC